VAAAVQQDCFLSLEAPVARVCGMDTPFPLTHEKLYLPDATKVFHAIKETVEF
jgi:2-oxoisovalerate dehydrogenase E1 component beta subunit